MTIGTRIAYLRKKQNLTQAELAALLFVSPKTVSKWENGYGLPDVKILPELSKTLCVDIDYLLTGIYPKQPQKQPPPVQEKIEYVEPEKGEYRLSLYQVTHNHLTKWVLFFNILVLVFSLIGGPIDVLNEQGDRFTTYTILAAIYPLLSVFGEANGWEMAVSILWLATLLFIVVTTAVMIRATLNGTNEYYVVISGVQFGAVFLICILSFIGSWLTNLYAGEIVMRLNTIFLLLLSCTFFQFVLNLLVSRHGKVLHGLKGVAALCFACLLAFSLTGAIVPQKIVPTVLDESSVEFAEPELTFYKTDRIYTDYSFTEFQGEGILAVAANIKINSLFEKGVRCFEETEQLYRFFDAEYLQTVYRNGKYFNFFRLEISLTAETGHNISGFSFESALDRDGRLYEFCAKSVQYISENEKRDCRKAAPFFYLRIFTINSPSLVST